MTISKEAKVGALALVSSIILYLGFNYLKGSEVFSGLNEYKVKFTNVDGLVTSNAVMLNGLQIGKVKSIDFLPEENNALEVVLSINKKVNVTEGTIAMLGDDGLLGGKNIHLLLGKNQKILPEWSYLASKTETGLTDLLMEKALPVLNNVDSLVVQLTKVSHQFDSTGSYLNKVLRTSNQTMGALNGTIAENRANLKAVSTNINTLTTNLIETEKSLKPLMGKFGSVADSLNALRLSDAVNTTKKSLESLQYIVADLQKGKGTAGKLLTSDSLYNNLNSTMANLDKLFINLKEEPKRYVHFSLFGKKDKKK